MPDSTSEIILSLFPTADRDNGPLRELAFRADRFTSAEILASRLDALVALFKFLRKSDRVIPEPLAHSEPAATVGKTISRFTDPHLKRELVWVSILESSATIRDRYHAGIAAILYVWLATPIAFTWYVLIGTTVTFAAGAAASLFQKRR